jgi:hypothetical protein
MRQLHPIVLLALVACATPTAEEQIFAEPVPGEDPNLPTEHETLEGAFAPFSQAAETFDVPVDLLLALSAAETGLQMVQGEEEFEGRARTFGLMALRDDVADEAAALAGLSPDIVRTHRRHNIAAAAALLSAWADEADIDRDDLGAWAPVVARYGDFEDDDAAAYFVHDAVYAALREGVAIEGVPLRTHDVVADFPLPDPVDNMAPAERSYAIWRASPNNSSRSGNPGMVIIHTCEGSYAGCWSWLSNSASGVSAHYVVNESGSEVSQLVFENRRAWHISATYDCSRNNNVDCWRNGVGSNDFTIGIEHACYGSQSSWSSGLISQSAQLVSDITDDWNIPKDAYHIVGHGQLQPWNRTDPGPNWPWSNYIAQIQGGSGGNPGGGNPTPPAGTRVIDSNNSANDQAVQYVEVSTNWSSSANVSGFYNTGYWWRTTGATSDPANFFFYNADATCYQVEAWWAAASDRSSTAPFMMVDGNGTVFDMVNVDQRANGGRWNVLGTYEFTSGWNRVALSRWTSAGAVVIADAVRLVPSTSCSGGGNPGGGSTPVQIVIDSDNANNGPDADVTYSSNWTSASATPGFYGSDYLFNTTQRPHDPVSFWFYLDDTTTVQVETRWTAGTNRAPNAPFAMLDDQTNLIGVARVNQQTNNNTWVDLGDYTFPAGWNRVALSRRAQNGYVVIADAVRVTEVP